MNTLALLLAPVALIVPSAAALTTGGDAELTPRQAADNELPRHPGWHSVEAPNTVPTADQVRIERRVTIRVAPRSPVPRQSLMAEMAVAPLPSNLTERKMGKCVPVTGIAGVQTGPGSQLILYMRDHRIVSANLEKACSARDFYSGFYLERSADGMLCVDRDRLKSRTGMQCQVSRMRQLVADD
jgi:hypothetical protein